MKKIPIPKFQRRNVFLELIQHYEYFQQVGANNLAMLRSWILYYFGTWNLFFGISNLVSSNPIPEKKR
jgi:hypothetical protein